MEVVALPLALGVPGAETLTVAVILGEPGAAWRVSTTAGSLPGSNVPDRVHTNVVGLQLPVVPTRTINITVALLGIPVIAACAPLNAAEPFHPNLPMMVILLNPPMVAGANTFTDKPVAAAFTTRETVVLCTRVPLVPVMVSV